MIKNAHRNTRLVKPEDLGGVTAMTKTMSHAALHLSSVRQEKTLSQLDQHDNEKKVHQSINSPGANAMQCQCEQHLYHVEFYLKVRSRIWLALQFIDRQTIEDDNSGKNE